MGKAGYAGSGGDNQPSVPGVASNGLQHGPARRHTVSVAVASSCIENAQNLELATLLAGQVARAAAIFNVDEIVVVDDAPNKQPGRISAAAALFARVLQFMETPQYLKKALIPMHQDLRYAGMLPPLDAPHHLRSSEWGPYREGVVRRSDPANGSCIDVGLEMDAHVDGALKEGVRVTVRMGDQPSATNICGQQLYEAELAHPAEPCQERGQYWGYLTRIAPTLQSLMDESPYPGGYDLTIGTSERGEEVACCQLAFPAFSHALLVIGGPQGLEHCLQNDPQRAQHAEPSTLFQRYLNVCGDQGSRTIRTEEALLITLTFLQPALRRSGRGA